MGYSYREETVTAKRWVVSNEMDAKDFNKLVDRANQEVEDDLYDDAYTVSFEDGELVITFRETVTSPVR